MDGASLERDHRRQPCTGGLKWLMLDGWMLVGAQGRYYYTLYEELWAVLLANVEMGSRVLFVEINGD